MNSSVVRFLWSCTLVPAVVASAPATILPFEILPLTPSKSTMPQDYGDAASAVSMPSTAAGRENAYLEGNGWTPQIAVSYTTERPGEFPQYVQSPVWPGVCALWSESFRTGRPIGENVAGAMPAGFAYYVTFAPAPGANRGVILNSFVLDDLNGYFDSVPHVVNWSVRQGSAQGPVLASGTANVANGENVTVQTGLAGTEPGSEPRVLVLQRMSGIEDDLALDDLDFDEMGFVTTSYNTGSLGATADGLNATGVVLNQQGAIADGADFSSYYAAQQNTAIPFLPEVNPPSDAAFTIEFWARPEASDNDDAPVFNRVSEGDRSGWVFFQRDQATGWNLRMYDGVGSDVGWDLTGGRYTFNKWSHVVAVWNGSQARLYVDGAVADTTNAAGRSGNYNASTSAIFSVGSYDNGGSPINGRVDEVAFYPSALTGAQILAHFRAATGPAAGSYASLVKGDGALIYLQQNPPQISIATIDQNPTLTFTGVLSQSPDLVSWSVLPVTSPFTVPSVERPGKIFFRAGR